MLNNLITKVAEVQYMDPKTVAATLYEKLKRDNLQEDDLIYILEKLRSPLVQQRFIKTVHQFGAVINKNIPIASPAVLSRLFEILSLITETSDDAKTVVTLIPGIEKMLLSAIHIAPQTFISWSKAILNLSRNVQFAVLLLKSDYGQFLLGGLKVEAEEAQLNVIKIYQNVCRLLPENPVLAEWQALDALACLLKSGSVKVKGEIVHLLVPESMREAHQIFLASSAAPLVDLLRTAPDQIKDQVLDIILNVSSHEGVKILLLDAGVVSVATELYQYAHGPIKNKSKDVLVAFGAMDEGGLHGVLNATVKGVGKVLDAAAHGVKYVALVPTVYTANAMVELLKSGSEDSKCKAAEVLMKMAQNDEENIFASREIIKPLVECQKIGSERARSKAAFALGKVTMNNPAAAIHIADELHYVVELLKSTDDEVKNTAMQALWMFSFQQECKEKLKNPEIVKLIRSFDGSPNLKDSAHMLLFQLGELKPKRKWPLVKKKLIHTREFEDNIVSGSLEIEAEQKLEQTTEFDEELPSPNVPDRHSPEIRKGNHIMISYNWGNQEMVKTIKKGLTSYGYNCWLDIEQMSGSTLEAMANAVEQASVVLICYSKKYKESAACRTEAEYAFTLKKPIIPLKMEHDYIPDGWLGALLGSKLYHEFSSLEAPEFATTMNVLIRELGDRGKYDMEGAMIPKEVVNVEIQIDQAQIKKIDITSWSVEEVVTWLDWIGLSNNASNFRSEFIDGKALYELFVIYGKTTPTEFGALISPLGLGPLGHRLRFQSELRELFK